jgi:uncharacterized damage-inducible protein DinB
MNVSFQEIAAGMIEKISRDLQILAENTPADRLNWQPSGDGGEGRTILDQLVECAFANRKWTLILREGAYRTLTPTERAEMEPPEPTLELALTLLRQTTAELAATIRALPDEFVAQRWTLEWNTKVTRTVAEACLHPYWNMAYHEGQISYIQTLYGDQEEHTDGGPFGE